MFSMLPDLAPHDSHTLWYTSSRNPFPSTALDPTANPNHPNNIDGPPDAAAQHLQRRGAAAVERSALARLRADEALHERRRHNVGNFGAAWLKPPGVAKSLFQMREERREAEEHAEAVRREQLAQQLAEAEGAAAAAAAGNQMMMEGDVMDEDGNGEGVGEAERDLDDEIPDAEEDGFGYDGGDSSDEEEDSDEDEDEVDDDDDDDNDDGPRRPSIGGAVRSPAEVSAAQQRREMRQAVATEDRALDLMSRRQAAQRRQEDMYPGAEDEDDLDDYERAEMLQEDDLVQPRGMPHGRQGLDGDDGLDMDMDGDLDDEIPEAESGGYEHTDSDASLTSSDEEDDEAPEASFAVGQQSASATFRGARGAAGPRHSLDMSSILSRDGSSLPGSSPAARRR